MRKFVVRFHQQMGISRLKAFDATCFADRTEARCSFEPGEKQSPPSDDLLKQIAAFRGTF